ncbi:universal stress protein [Sphingobacterium detergens]|uniref:Nucleotide-binding universal stress UspA family protein n=1 Tax=Sphingobacterium detergens TaxID=1145106 RepID=A0A420B831_SPHD1|nr:universal stress protein [Sphingobacterium detergens]RKE52950.1 nucleotide-binding universal stress UspA family protein [Sphingobacterium detergens]
MSRLLIPVDFSENAEVAANYAAQIAQETHDEITLFHSFTSHINKFANAKHLIDPTEEDARGKMEKLVAELLQKYPSIKISTLFTNGILAESLEKQEIKENYQTVIMGTKGVTGLESVLIGSNTYDVIKESKIPVLAIPKNAVKLKKDNIALLTNFKPGELEVLKQAIPLYGKDFHLQLIHINKNDLEINILGSKLEKWIEQIIAETGIEDISYIVKAPSYFAGSRENIANGIHTIIRDEDIDVILITKSRKTFFQNIFTENIVKHMAFEIEVPNFFGRVS